MEAFPIKFLREFYLLFRAKVDAESTTFASFHIYDYFAHVYLSPSNLSILRRIRLLSISPEIEYFSA